MYLSRHMHSTLSLLPSIAVVECSGQGTQIPSSMLSSLYVPTGQAVKVSSSLQSVYGMYDILTIRDILYHSIKFSAEKQFERSIQ